jgi:hypothetical protein
MLLHMAQLMAQTAVQLLTAESWRRAPAHSRTAAPHQKWNSSSRIIQWVITQQRWITYTAANVPDPFHNRQ